MIPRPPLLPWPEALPIHSLTIRWLTVQILLRHATTGSQSRWQLDHAPADRWSDDTLVCEPGPAVIPVRGVNASVRRHEVARAAILGVDPLKNRVTTQLCGNPYWAISL